MVIVLLYKRIIFVKNVNSYWCECMVMVILGIVVYVEGCVVYFLFEVYWWEWLLGVCIKVFYLCLFCICEGR